MKRHLLTIETNRRLRTLLRAYDAWLVDRDNAAKTDAYDEAWEDWRRTRWALDTLTQ